MTKPHIERLHVLLHRIYEWEELEDAHPSEAEELLMDIKQCLESIIGTVRPDLCALEHVGPKP